MRRQLVPANPLAEVITKWMRERDGRTLGTLADLTGLPERRLYGIRSGKQACVELTTADKLLTRLDHNELWHLDHRLSRHL